MDPLKNLFDNNRQWAEDIETRHPGFFNKLSKQQAPDYLWIGCSDSRVTANEIVGLLPGELFVHRNVANLVIHTDMNCLSVLQYAVEILRVKHVIVCGHYGCGGVRTVLEETSNGLIDNWLRNIFDVAAAFKAELDNIEKFEQRVDRLCELNVVEQVMNLGGTTIIQDAWKRNQDISIHGWIYGLKDGLLRNLNVSATNKADWTALCQRFSPRIVAG